MADNYIEKQYELYEAKKAAWKKSRIKSRNTAKKSTQSTPATVRKVFITGGAKGIGKALVEAFCKVGHQVAFCDVDMVIGNETARTSGARFYPVDVSQKEELKNCFAQLIDQWGDIDILINNVGISQFSPITQTEVETFDHILAVNLRPIFILARQWALHRQKNEGNNSYGRMINLCSTRQQMSEPGSEGYAASKGGIYSLTHALAISLSPFHITVNSISPGWIETGDYQSLQSSDHLQHPSLRVGRPEDVAQLALFLCQDGNDFINGENITLDGGMTRKMIYQ